MRLFVLFVLVKFSRKKKVWKLKKKKLPPDNLIHYSTYLSTHASKQYIDGWNAAMDFINMTENSPSTIVGRKQSKEVMKHMFIF